MEIPAPENGVNIFDSFTDPFQIPLEDAGGKPLKADGIYEITIPANVPISSKDDLVFNADGSVTLTYGSEQPAGRPASNHVHLNGKGYWFGEMRFYGPEKPLFDKSWQMTDIAPLSSRFVFSYRHTLMINHGREHLCLTIKLY